MKRHTLEYRIARLERYIKNEFIDQFDKPKRSEEKEWVNDLFSKYKSLKSSLTTNLNSVTDTNKDSPFNLILSSKDKCIDFLITSKGNRDEMSCTAFNKGDNAKIDSLKKFHLNNEINKVAAFILQTLKSHKCESRSRKFEEVSLTALDCQYILKSVDRLLSDISDNASSKVEDDNSDYGFINVAIYNPNYVTDYDIIARDYNKFEVIHNDKNIRTVSDLKKVAEVVVNDFSSNYM